MVSDPGLFVSLAKLACRQQLEEMAEKFNFPSSRGFAAEILARTSAQRVTWLREYYTSLNQPDLSNTVAEKFPPLQSVQTTTSSSSSSSPCTSKVTGSHRRTRKTDPKATLKTLHEAEAASNPGSCIQKLQKRQRISRRSILQLEGQEETALGTAGGLGHGQAGSSSGPESAEAAAASLDGMKTDPLSLDVTRGRSMAASKPAGPGLESEPKPSSLTTGNVQGRGVKPSSDQQAAPSPSRQSFLAELIGDTSILDDLLKPKSRSTTRPSGEKRPTKPLSTEEFVSGSPKPNALVAEKSPAKARRKDFWDIVNEGNEESINRLTDPAEVQKACVNSKFAAERRSAEGERKSLWKTNENFLWKQQ